jgi:hypothetical protein
VGTSWARAACLRVYLMDSGPNGLSTPDLTATHVSASVRRQSCCPRSIGCTIESLPPCPTGCGLMCPIVRVMVLCGPRRALLPLLPEPRIRI